MAYNKKDISAQIPEYCNERLNPEEKAAFERELENNQELQAEYSDFKKMREMYSLIDPDEPEPSDAIFNRIAANVGLQTESGEKAAPAARSLTESVRGFLQTLRASVAVPWVLAGLQAAVIVLLLVPSLRENNYSTLSAEHAAAGVAEQTGINVVFAPDAKESDIRSLLLTIHGSVSSGPSMEGRYVVSIGDRSNLEQALQTLKQSEIIVFVEPVY